MKTEKEEGRPPRRPSEVTPNTASIADRSTNVKKAQDLSRLLDKPVTYHRCFVDVLPGEDMRQRIVCAILLTQAIHWSKLASASKRKGFFWKTAREWHEETGLTRRLVDSANATLAKSGVLQHKVFGVPPRSHYKIDWPSLNALLAPYLSAKKERTARRKATARPFADAELDQYAESHGWTGEKHRHWIGCWLKACEKSDWHFESSWRTSLRTYIESCERRDPTARHEGKRGENI